MYSLKTNGTIKMEYLQISCSLQYKKQDFPLACKDNYKRKILKISQSKYYNFEGI